MERRQYRQRCSREPCCNARPGVSTRFPPAASHGRSAVVTSVHEPSTAVPVRHDSRAARLASNCDPGDLLLQGLPGVRALPRSRRRCAGRARRHGHRSHGAVAPAVRAGPRRAGLHVPVGDRDPAVVRELLPNPAGKHPSRSKDALCRPRAQLSLVAVPGHDVRSRGTALPREVGSRKRA